MKEIKRIKTKADVATYCQKQVALFYASIFTRGKLQKGLADYSVKMVLLGKHLHDTGLFVHFEEFYRKLK